ncbi:2-keto-4-pentenoate hydratase (plasmid) [Nocardioides sp. R1-1]|uniref:2-keto-4-pentenoate hydratase n=1 Tax=Nocardioides sp. R1-1 TaxID=3383502 RepID=UPI0038D0271F
MTQARLDTAIIEEAATRLLAAAAVGRPCAPIRDLVNPDDLAMAYAIQQRITESRTSRGARVVGRKIGLTSPAVQQQLRVGQPDFGMLFDDMVYQDGDVVPFDAVLQPRAEAEIAFVLRSDLDRDDLDIPTVRTAIEYAVAAIEICGSRIDDWDITFADTVADNASSGAFVLGTDHRSLEDFEPREVEMSMSVDGDVVSAGSGAACLGDPLEAVLWLARQARSLGDPLRAGQVILSGALGPMRAAAPGVSVTAEISGLGTVSVRFGNDWKANS